MEGKEQRLRSEMIFEEETVKAHVSITCVPWVLIILSVCPASRGMARPCLAGMSLGTMMSEIKVPKSQRGIIMEREKAVR